jgi:peptidoglycan/xylan/chitin deacetylase (PgdA/CDA1 family)
LLKNKAIKSKALVLTFDDGPGNRLTPAILKVLAKNRAKATFFLLGRNIAGREAIVRQIAEQGHDICSHGYDHLDFWKISPIRAVSDIKRSWKTIDAALGYSRGVYPFRPPYGRLNLISSVFLWIYKVPIIYWTIDSGDTWPHEQRNSERATHLARNAGGGIVLVHDNDRLNPDTESMVLESVRSTLDMAKETGIQILAVSELLCSYK